MGSSAIKRYCLIVFCTTAGMGLPPMVAPVRMQELELSGELSGIIMALPFLLLIPLIPFMDTIILWIGLEYAILGGACGYMFGMLAEGIAVSTDNV